MPNRSWIAVVLLVSYLLIAGAGGMTRPEDGPERVLVQTSQSDRYVSDCRYLRMDGLEAFLNEALATRYRQADETAPHQSITVVLGLDIHCLPPLTTFSFLPSGHSTRLAIPYRMASLSSPHRLIDAPPWLI